MTNSTFTREETVAEFASALLAALKLPMTAQGIEREYDLTSFHPVTLQAMLNYGARRWVQDSVNSQCHAAKKADEDFDAVAIFDARIMQAMSGDVTARRTAAPINPLGKYVLEVLNAILPKADGADAILIRNGLKACKTTQERRDYAVHVLSGNQPAMDQAQAMYDAAHKPVAVDLSFNLD